MTIVVAIAHWACCPLRIISMPFATHIAFKKSTRRDKDNFVMLGVKVGWVDKVVRVSKSGPQKGI